ncbi:hypothetical protein GC167_00700 [bacterium]|nr:hypothetical protein [bacterium]
MKRPHSKVLHTLAVAAIAMGAGTACTRENDFSDIPFLRFESYEQQTQTVGGVTLDNLLVRIYFTDGNGDIGLEQSDSVPPYDVNLLVRTFEPDGDTVVEVFDYDFDTRIPNLTPEGQNKALEGVIEFDMDVSLRGSDSLQFSFVLLDRALNRSNEVFSPLIVLD